MPARRDPNPTIRRVQRVLLMVHELHKRGYQRLRIVPGMSPYGMHWRFSITPVTNILTTRGALYRDFDHDVAHYSSGSSNLYFGWQDAKRDTTRQLARKFVDRFPDLANKGLGPDWAYAGWYVEMLGLAERGCFPIEYSDWDHEEPDDRWLPTTCDSNAPANLQDARLPMPPPGEASPQDESH